MSILWRLYHEGDVEGFRAVLETASYSARQATPRLNTGVTGLSADASTSPNLSSKNRKSSGKNSVHGLASQLVLTRAEINQRDALNGLTLLHLAASSASENALDFATGLLEHPLIDLYIQDIENGWTALHRAFYFGNIATARAILGRDRLDLHGRAGQKVGGLVKVKDKEGNGPFDLLGSTIKDRTLHPRLELASFSSSTEDGDEENVGLTGDDDDNDGQRRKVMPIVNVQADELFTFGSNKNLTLGFGDEDDRQYPERVVLRRPDHLLQRFYREHLESLENQWSGRDQSFSQRLQSEASASSPVSELPSMIRARPLIIQDVRMSKLHTAVLTNDPESNLHVCGFGPGGRLGTGDELTRFTFTCVEGGALTGKRIASVALGQHHTLAISDEGEIYSWGSNIFGQLGYSLPKPNAQDHEPVQLLPRQIFGSLKREVVIGIAASRTHSVAHTTHSLYTFGKNEGQLGLVDSDARSLEIQGTPRKVAASLFSYPISMVSAIDRATTCLLENHEVWVFANYGWVKIAFPLEASPNSFFRESFNVTSYDRAPNRIRKIASGGDTICALSSRGEVFAITVGYRSETTSASSTSTTNPSKIRNALSFPQSTWSPKKSHMTARDIDVDCDGSIILATEAGSVWRRTKRPKMKQPNANTSDEHRPKDYKFSRVPGLTRVTAVRSSAHGAYAALRKDCNVTKTQITVSDSLLHRDTLELLSFKGLASLPAAEDSEELELAFWNRPSQIERLRRRLTLSPDTEANLLGLLRSEHQDSETLFDVVISTTTSELQIPAHTFILSGRSPVFRQTLAEYRSSGNWTLSDVASIQRSDQGRLSIVFLGFDVLSILIILMYFYTDHVADVWNHQRHVPQYLYRSRQVRSEVMKLASRLHLLSLEPAVRQMVQPPRSLSMDLEVAIKDPTFFESGDIDVQLSACIVRVHSVLMTQRCPFFNGLFHGKAAGMWLADRRETLQQPVDLLKVDLKHVDLEIFRLVLRHLYADTGEELFDEIISSDVEDFLDIVMEVMSVANELMIDRLSEVCQKVLGRFVNIRNVGQLLNAVAPSSVSQFKNTGLEYLCLSLEAALEYRTLDELDEDLMFELGEVVRGNQLAGMPFARSGRAERILFEKYPELQGLISQQRQDRICANAGFARQAGEGRLSTSLGRLSYDELSSSPVTSSGQKMQHMGSRQVTLESSHPTLTQKSSAADLMFEMDHDEDPVAEAVLGSRLSTDQVEDSQDSQRGLIERSESRAGPHQISSSVPSQQTLTEVTPSEQSQPTNMTGPDARGWVTSPLQSAKLDLSEIMAQASSSRVSSLSAEISAQATQIKEPAPRAMKLSQRERKKQQQEAQKLAIPTTTPSQVRPVAAPAGSKAPPWQTVPKASSIALKDVLGQTTNPSPESSGTRSKPTGSPAAPQLTMRQTVAGQKSVTESPSTVNAEGRRPVAAPRSENRQSAQLQPASLRSPAVRSPPASAPRLPPGSFPSPSTQPPIQSIRHIPRAAEPSLQLSMADILSQQQAEKEVIKEAMAKRSLMDIQAEQEFQQWWDAESKRTMEADQRKRDQPFRADHESPGARKSKLGKGRRENRNPKADAQRSA